MRDLAAHRPYTDIKEEDGKKSCPGTDEKLKTKSSKKLKEKEKDKGKGKDKKKVGF